MDSHDGRNWESSSPLSSPASLYNDSGRDTAHGVEGRPRPRPRLLDLFPQTPADDPAEKRRCLRQEGLSMSHTYSGVELGSRNHDLCTFSLSNHPTSGSLSIETTIPHPYAGLVLHSLGKRSFFQREGPQMRDTDKWKALDVTKSKLGSQEQDFCALSLSMYSASLSFADKIVSPNLEGNVTNPSIGRVPLRQESTGKGLVPLEREPASLFNRGQPVSFGAESIHPSNRREVPLHFTRGLRTLRERILSFVGTSVHLGAQPVGAVSHHNRRQLAQSSQQQPEGQAQTQPAPPSEPAQTEAPAWPHVQQHQAQPQSQTSAEIQVQQPLGEAPTRLEVQPPPQQSRLRGELQVLQQPGAQTQGQQPRPQALEQHRAQPDVQKSRQQARRQPRSRLQDRPQTLLQPRAQAPAQPRSEAPDQHGVQPPIQQSRKRARQQTRVQQSRLLDRPQTRLQQLGDQAPVQTQAQQPRAQAPDQHEVQLPVQQSRQPAQRQTRMQQSRLQNRSQTPLQQLRTQAPAQTQVQQLQAQATEQHGVKSAVQHSRQRAQRQNRVQQSQAQAAHPYSQPQVQPRVQRRNPVQQSQAQVQPRVQRRNQGQQSQAQIQPRVQRQNRVQQSQAQDQPRVPRRNRVQQSQAQATHLQAQPQVQPRVQGGHQSRSSSFKGVSYYKRTTRWETNFWNKGSQIYLGASSTENQAARAYDRATIHFRGVNAKLNFPLANYVGEVRQLQALTDKELVKMLRKQSAGDGTLYPQYPHP